MKAYITCTAIFISLIINTLPAQDFIFRGCYETCLDSSNLPDRIKKLRDQVADLSYRGFTTMWLPPINPKEVSDLEELIKALRKNGMQPIVDLTIPDGDAFFQLMPLSAQLKNDFQIKNFRIVSEETPQPVVIANFLNEYYNKNENPGLVYADIPTLQTTEQYTQWINKVLQNLHVDSRQNILPRVYDYPLREALRQACSAQDYDVRDIYTSSLRDATALIGYNVVTGVNKESFFNKNNEPDDADDFIENPLLAYAYLLTNNQIGLPEIFYTDYFGLKTDHRTDAQRQPLKNEIDQLLKAHREYIVNSTEIEYLNRKDTDKESIYLSANDGADASRVLLFQLDGTHTPASKASKKTRDVIVAINFSDATLKVIQQVNLSNVRTGDVFTDVLGRSAESSTRVQARGDLNLPNAIYLELPPRSYSIWVQGEASTVSAERLSLAIQAFDDFVELTWEAPSETDIKHYEIEKSINGSAFQRIASVNPLSEAGAAYLYTDEVRLVEDEFAYRVKTVYKNGTTLYSMVQELKPLLQGLSFELLDNAKPGVKTLKIKSNQQCEGKIAVFNAAGKQVLVFTQLIKKGISLAQVDLSALPKGIYLLNINTKDKVWTKKIINR